MSKVCVIGGGPAGLMAAYAAANNGHEVVLLEKNEKLGKKIYITGKGRCNFTNDVSAEEFLQNVVRGERFLRGVIYSFPPQKVIEFFENQGLAVKTERGNRVFPASDHASDVTKALEKACKNSGVAMATPLSQAVFITVGALVFSCRTPLRPGTARFFRRPFQTHR